MKTKKIIETLILAALCTGTAYADPISLQNASITATYNGAASGMLGLDNMNGLPVAQNVSGLDVFNTSTEFLTADFLFGFDFDASGALTILANSAIPVGQYTMRFDFGNSLSQAITGFALVDASAIGGIPGLAVINAHTIELNLSNVSWNGDFAAFTTQLSTAAAVKLPEPGSTTIVLAGLAGLALARRSRKPRA
jgi:hypothetical protein